MYLYQFVELLYDRGVGVDLQDVLVFPRVGGLHGCGRLESLHVGSVGVDVGRDDCGGVDQTHGDTHLLDHALQLALGVLNQRSINLCEILHFLPELVSSIRFLDMPEGHIHNLGLLVLLKSLEDGLIKGIITQDDLIPFRMDLLNDGASLQHSPVLPSQEVDLLLPFLHVSHDLIKRDQLGKIAGSVPSSDLTELVPHLF